MPSADHHTSLRLRRYQRTSMQNSMKIDEPVIQFAEGVNEIQYVQRSMVEVAEKQV